MVIKNLLKDQENYLNPKNYFSEKNQNAKNWLTKNLSKSENLP